VSRARKPVLTPATCPKREEHTPCPSGYVAWHDWADQMSKAHRQIRHEPCGLLTVWVPR
jgi:hypothetical protein